MNAGLEVEGVTKRFGGTPALDDVSFSVQQGEVLALQNLELIGLLYHLDKAVYRHRAQDAMERM
jgi:ABC-type uncharacterized transport system ATPase subunit